MTNDEKILEQFRTEISKAEEARRVVSAERDAAVREATEAIHKQFQERMSSAYDAASKARQAEYDYINENASHPWEGKRVMRTDKKPTSKWSSKYKDVTTYGVVEVRRQGTQMPANCSWGLPSHGQAFVRLIKANGEVGKKINQDRVDARYSNWQGEKAGQTIWALVEPEQ